MTKVQKAGKKRVKSPYVYWACVRAKTVLEYTPKPNEFDRGPNENVDLSEHSIYVVDSIDV